MIRISKSVFTEWDGTTAHARILQGQLAGQVVIADDFPPLHVVAGVDAGFEDGGTITRAAAVLLDAHSLDVLAEHVVRAPTSMAYVPGLLSFRELPALLQALGGLPRTPDLVFCDGHGIAHPRRLGIAAHLGVTTGLPAIGVAKSILVGTHAELGSRRGDSTPLRHRGEIIGTVLRTKDRVRPVIVSPGHRVSLERAPELVLSVTTRYRLPEPTRLADRLASRRFPRSSP